MQYPMALHVTIIALLFKTVFLLSFCLAIVSLQSPIQASLLKLDPKNTQINKLAVECFIGKPT